MFTLHGRQRLERYAPEIAVPLLELDLLYTIVPEREVDAEVTRTLAEQLLPLIQSGALDRLAKDSEAFSTLSNSRLGFHGDEAIARSLQEELINRGLARPGGEFSFPLHRQVRALILTILAQILRNRGPRHHRVLQPATDQPQLIQSLTDLIEQPKTTLSARVVSTDFETVGVDLSNVPLNEVLDYRHQHLAEHRAYAEELEHFVRTISPMDAEDRTAEIAWRSRNLKDLAADVRRNATSAWKRPATVAFGAAGALWNVFGPEPDPIAALLALGGTVSGVSSAEPDRAGAYSYLFQVRDL